MIQVNNILICFLMYTVAIDAGKELQESETQAVENGKVPSGQDSQTTIVPPADLGTTSRKIEVPNNKVLHDIYRFIFHFIFHHFYSNRNLNFILLSHECQTLQ